MPPRHELNERFHGHIRRARRVRVASTAFLSGLTILAVVGSAAFAFHDIAPDMFARATAAPKHLASQVAATSRESVASVLAPLRTMPSAATEQLATASQLPWLDAAGESIFAILCPIFRDCPSEPQLTEDQKSQRTTNSQNVKFVDPIPSAAPGVATTSPRVVSGIPASGTASPPQTVINQLIIERIREVQTAGVNAAYVDARIAALAASMQRQFDATADANATSFRSVSSSASSPTSVAASAITGTITNAISSALATITDLTSTTITATNATFTNATTTNATTTTFYVSATSTTEGLRVSSLDCSSLGNGGTLTTDANGNVVCAADDGGSGSVGGSNTQVQFNDAGSLGADSTFTFDKNAGRLSFSLASSSQQSILDALHIGRTATTTIRGDGLASTIPFASTTALTVSGTAYIGSLNGPLQANNGTVSATTSIGTVYGGTGLTSAPSYGQLLVGNASGGYTLTATSSLGLASATSVFGKSWEVSGGFLSPTSTSYIVNIQQASSTLLSANWLKVGGTASTTIDTAGNVLIAGTLDVTGKSTLGNASTTQISASYASSSQGFFGSLSIGSLSGFLKATAGAISTALVDLASNVTGILPVANGGTGWSQIESGAVVFGNGSGQLATTTAGTNGQVLALVGGTPTWIATTTLSTISGTLSGSQLDGVFSSNGLLARTTTGTYASRTLTGTTNQITVANGDGVSGNPTLSLPSLLIFSQASSTLLSNTGTAYFGGTATATISSAGVLTLPSALAVSSGGTGQTTFSSGQLLYGNGTNALSSVATTSATIGSSLSYSGTFGSLVGGSVGTLSLNTGNANTWTALQSFSNSSSTIASVLDALYVGRTATTTIRGDGVASTLPYASTTALSATTLCLTSDCRTSWPSGGGSSFGQSWEIGGNGLTGFLAPTTTQKLWLGQASSTVFSANYAQFGGSATTTFTLDGKVGIGTTNPSYALDVNGDVNVASGKCFRVNGVCIGYTVKLAAIFATSTPSGATATTTVSFTGAQGSAPSYSGGASPTLTLPSNTSYIVSETWGGGGAGGGGAATPGCGGGGGGAGGYSQKLYATLSAKYFYNVGAPAAASAFGDGSATTTANGGTAGTTGSSGTCNPPAGGPGGTASGGDINITGQGGQDGGGSDSTFNGEGGVGGTAPHGGGGGKRGTAGAAPGGGGGGNIGQVTSSASGASGGVVITVYATSSPTVAGNDYAEMFPVSNPTISAGDVVAVDTGIPISMKLAEKGDTALAGVISTNPGQVLGDQNAVGERPVALSGRVPVKFSGQNGPVKIGDRIAPSSRPGVGMKAGPFDNSVGIVIGTIEHGESGDTVMIFLDLHQGLDINALALTLLGGDTSLFAANDNAFGSTTASFSSGSANAPLDFVGGIISALGKRIGSFTFIGVASSTRMTTEATSTAPTSPADTYVTGLMHAIFGKLSEWFADAANGIAKIVTELLAAKRVETEELCVDDVCVTRDQFAEVFGESQSASAAAGSSGTHTDAATGSEPGSAGSADSGLAIIAPEDDNSATSTAAGSSVQEAAGTAGGAGGTAAVPNGQGASAPGGSTAAEPPVIYVSGNNPTLIEVNSPNEAADEADAPEALQPAPELAPANENEPVTEQSTAVNE